jgi:predicted outer membrane repeat protein
MGFKNWLKGRGMLAQSSPAESRRRSGRARARANLSVEPLEDRTLLSGGWTPLDAQLPNGDSSNTMVLLSDGRVMVHGGGSSPSTTWYALNPAGIFTHSDFADPTYIQGSWSQMQSMNVARRYFPSAVLPNGNVFVVGGEYSTPYDFTDTAEIYNPQANSWTSVANAGAGTNPPLTTAGSLNPPPKAQAQPQFGDDPIEVLPNTASGQTQILAGYFGNGTTYLYNASTNTWATTSTGKQRGDRSDEETWVKLPDNSILSYDIYASESSPPVFHAQRFIPSTDQWVDASTVNPAKLPSLLSGNDVGQELGPGFLTPNDQVIYFGAEGNTAIYDVASGVWSAGPAEPQVTINGSTKQLVAADVPGAMMSNGDILIAFSPKGSLNSKGSYQFQSPSFIYEYNPTSQQFTDVTPPGGISAPSFQLSMLALPNGQVLLGNETSSQMWVFAPNELPQEAWKPTVMDIQDITSTGASGALVDNLTLTGTKLNGISEGANYGDDAEMASNYPLVHFTQENGGLYARTSNWSSTGVQTGSAADPGTETTQFTGPTEGASILTVSAAGIASDRILYIQPDLFNTTNLTIRNIFTPSALVELLGDNGEITTLNPADTPWSSIIIAGSGSTNVTLDFSNLTTIPTENILFDGGIHFSSPLNPSAVSTFQVIPPPGVTPTWSVTGPNSGTVNGNIVFRNVVPKYPVTITTFTVPQAVEGQASLPPVVATFSDPDPTVRASDFTATVVWGDGQSSVETAANLGILDNHDGTFSVVTTHVYGPASGGAMFSVTIVCDHLGSASRSAPLHVFATPIPPGVGIVVTSAVEGVPVTEVSTFAFGGSNTEAEDLDAGVNWGDGTFDDLTMADGGIVRNPDGTLSIIAKHTYAEEGLTQNGVDFTIVNSDGSSASGDVGVPFMVQDAPLTVTALTPPEDREAGSQTGFIRLATFKDANTNPDITDYSATVNWGDGSSDTFTPAGGSIIANGDGTFSVFGNHLYSSARLTAPFSVTINDAGGSKVTTRATDVVVNTTSDVQGHTGTALRDAISQAVSDATQGNWDTIVFDPTVFATPQTILLTQGPLELKPGIAPITINGNGLVAISGGGTGGVFKVDPGAQASLSGLTIENGQGNGGGVQNFGQLTVTDCTFTNNSSLIGGGAIENLGALTVSDSTFTNNSSQSGGAIFNLPFGNLNATATVTNSTFTNNSAQDGTAIFNGGGTVAVAGCTISGNSTSGIASGIDNEGTLFLSNSIVAGNTGGANIAGSFTDLGSNLLGTELNNGQRPFSDHFTDAPPLLPLGNYGGLTQTLALNPVAGNPAVGAGGLLTTVTALAPAGATSLQVITAAAIASTDGVYALEVGGEALTVSRVEGNTLFLLNELTTAISPGVPVFLAEDQRGVSRTSTCPDIGAFQTQSGNQITTASDLPGHQGISLRDAVNLAAAESLASGTMQTVTIPADISSITVTSPIVINGGLITLTSEGPVNIDGNNVTKLFQIGPGANVTLGSGSAVDTRLTFENADPAFGAISNAGTLTVTNSDFSNNFASVSGGAIYNTGSLTITNCSFEDNIAGGSGGAIENNGGTLVVSGCLLENNLAFISGGAIDNHAGVASISNTTVVNNFASLGSDLLNEANLTLGFDNAIGVFAEAANSGYLIIDDSADPGSATYSITASTVQVAGSSPITYTGAASLTVLGGNGTSTFNVEGTTAATPVTLVTGPGGGVVNVAPTDKTLTDIQGSLTIQGGGRTSAMLDDQNDILPFVLFFPNIYTVTNATVSNGFAATIHYSGLRSLTLNGSSADDLYNIESTALGTATNVNTGASNNTVNVSPTDKILADIQGDLTIQGAGHTVANLDDQNDSFSFILVFPNFYTVTSSTVSSGFSATIHYSGLSALTLNGDSAEDIYDVESTAAGTPVTINTGAGTSAVNVTQTAQNLGNLGSFLTVHGGVGTTLLYVDDQTDTATPSAYTITGSSIAGLFSAPIVYTGLQGVTLNGSGGPSAYYVVSTSAATPVTVNGGAGDDTFNLGGPANTLDPLKGPVTVNGGGGADTLNVNDQGQQTGQTYTLTPTSLARPGVALISFGAVANVMIGAGSGNDTLVVAAPVPAPAVAFNGGGGSNTVTGPNAANTWQITGTNAGTLGGVAYTATQNLTGGSVSDDFQILKKGILSGKLDGGAGAATLDYATYPSGIAVNLAAGSATGVGGVTHIGTVIGSTHNDTITGNLHADTTIFGGGGVDQLQGGGDGRETYLLAATQKAGTVVTGGAGIDTLVGANTANTWTLTGPGAGNVANVNGVSTFTGIANLQGGPKADSFVFLPGGGVAGTVNGGGGNDTLDYSGNGGAAVAVNLQTGAATATGGFSNITSLVGSSAATNSLTGANTANAWIINGTNAGKVNGSFSFTAVENLTGGSGNDAFAFRTAGQLTGSLDGQGDSNTLDYSAYAGNIIVDLRLGEATAVAGTVHNIQSVIGGQVTSILVGDGRETSLTGGTGRNLLIAGPKAAAAPALVGKANQDILVGGSTDYDLNVSALNAIMAEWARTDIGYAARVNHLLHGGGLNGATLLNSSTFHGNGGGNVLTGAAGLDLFYGSKALDQSDWNAAQGEIFIEGQAHQNTEIDARGLSLPSLALDGMVISTQTLSTLFLAPGPHTLTTTEGLGNSLTFFVAADGTVDYDLSLNGVLAGRGTTTLVVSGVTVTIDARALSIPVLDVDNALFAKTDQPISFTGLPGGAFLDDYAGGGAMARFGVGADGTVSYDPALAGVLSGSGTSALTVHGVTITIDARALSIPVLDVDNALFAKTDQPISFTGLPGGAFLDDYAGGGAMARFGVGADGTVSYDPALAGVLSGQGTSTLVVRGATVTIDATALAMLSLLVDGVAEQTAAPFTFTCLPGTLTLVDPQSGALIRITINLDGTIDYDHSLDNLLSGRGTSTLIVHGFPGLGGGGPVK